MNSQEVFDARVREEATATVMALRSTADLMSQGCTIDRDSIFRTLIDTLRTIAADGVRSDGRAIPWRCRLRLFDMQGAKHADPVADTDPDKEADQMGETIILSLPAVASWIAELACAHHGGPCSGLDAFTLRRKLHSLRVQISNRKDGTGCWRLDYSCVDYDKFGAKTERYMVARCDLERVQ